MKQARKVMLVMLALGVPEMSAGQGRSAALAGSVTDTVGRPISAVAVTASGRDLSAVTDSLGRFILSGLPGGNSRIGFQRIGFAPESITVALHADSTVMVGVQMRATQTLPDVTVRAATQSPRLARDGFYDRQTTGWGRYVTPEDIAKLSVGTPSQLLRNVPFVHLDCDAPARRATGGCIVYGSNKACMSLFVDGVYTRGHLDQRVSAGMVYAMEVYTRSAIVPMNFQRPANERQCGAVVVWTQSRAP
jgi:hypothetical protein